MRCDSFCQVGDKVVHLFWLHIFKYIYLLKIKQDIFYIHKHFSGYKECKFLLTVKKKKIKPGGLQD